MGAEEQGWKQHVQLLHYDGRETESLRGHSVTGWPRQNSTLPLGRGPFPASWEAMCPAHLGAGNWGSGKEPALGPVGPGSATYLLGGLGISGFNFLSFTFLLSNLQCPV